MNPAFSVIFLTTLIGMAQGLFMALTTTHFYNFVGITQNQPSEKFFIIGGISVLVLATAGLIASLFHLGRPERAWRAATQWRTSWLSREVILLPIFMFFAFLYTLYWYMGWNHSINLGGVDVPLNILIGIIGSVFSLLLFIATGMIYACIKFIQEWANPITVINYTLFGLSSGFTLAVLLSYYYDSIQPLIVIWAASFTILALVTRLYSLVRNSSIKPKSKTSTAIGVRFKKIRQMTAGAMGGSFNTRAFFHHQTDLTIKVIKLFFIITALIIPSVAYVYMMSYSSYGFLPWLVLIQYVGLLAERWFFFAQANHPQNIYYQAT